jgi:hypothetical protein|tara:strand:+ start:362 stop:670 length:309 start_codon:yes stop_codon:yes gene_type:complete
MVKEPNRVAIQSQVDVTKSSGGVLDYAFNWSDVIQSTETISTSNWTVSSSDLTLVSQSLSGVTTTAFISGGRNNYYYQLVNTITTDQSRSWQRVMDMKVESK